MNPPSDLKKNLRELGITDYDKASPFLFDKVKHLISGAKINASRVNLRAKETAAKGKDAPHYLNPYTDIHELFEDMERFIKNEPSVRAKD